LPISYDVIFYREFSVATLIRRGWTAEDIEKLRRLAGKRPPAEIATELGRTPGSLAVKAHEFKISLKVEKKLPGDRTSRVLNPRLQPEQNLPCRTTIPTLVSAASATGGLRDRCVVVGRRNRPTRFLCFAERCSSLEKYAQGRLHIDAGVNCPAGID
jgi:hypothetical protein